MGWVFNFGSLGGLTILSILLAFFINIITKLTTDQNKLKRIKERQKEIQKSLKEHKHDPQTYIAKQKEAQPEILKLTKQYMFSSMKSMIYTFIPLIIIFGWMRGHFGTEKVLNLGFISFGWLWTYIILSILFSSIIRKLLKVY